MAQIKGNTWKWSIAKELRHKIPMSDEHKKKLSISKLGIKNPCYKNGTTSCRGDGYIRVLLHEHPNANGRGYIMQHRLVMSKHLGRPLEKNEFVHHINCNRKDNRIENLELIKGRSEHSRKHIYTTNKSWMYIKNKNIICPHCNKEIQLEQVLKIS